MNQLKTWLKKKKIDNFREELLNNHYFYNVACPACPVLHFCFELTDNEILTRQALETIEKIEKYCKRYNYIVFNNQSIFGGVSYTYFYVANRSDYEKYMDYIRFMELSVNECELLHSKKGNYAKLNDDMKKIMNEYESMYIDFLEAIKHTA